MIYALKLLAVVLAVTGIAAFVFRSALSDLFSATEYKRVWTLVSLGVAASYLCGSPALFLMVIAGIGVFGAAATGRGPVGKVGIYLLFACTLPPIALQLGGFGGINYVLSLDHRRLLSLLLLGWAALELVAMKAGPRTVKFFWVDLFIVAYQLFRLVLLAPHSNWTTLLRFLVESTLDVLLPYFVLTRAVRSMADLRFMSGHLLIGLAFAACVGVAESLLQHNLYSGLQSIYGIHWQLTYALMRGGLIRVQATTPQPIILGIMMLFAIGMAYWLKGRQWRRPAVAALFAVICITEIATFSRGPWLAALLVLLTLVAMRRLSSTAFRILLISALLCAVALKSFDADQQIVAALGAVFGSDQADISSIEYRRQLLDTSLALIKQSPWVGVPNYAAQMQSLQQGEGIIDLVNSYLAILLDAGVVGLTIYLLPFGIVLNRLISAVRRREGGALDEAGRFAVAFVALIVGCLFSIFTASTFNVIPLLLTLLVALPTAWLGLSPAERNVAGSVADIDLDLSAERLPSDPLPMGPRFS